VRLELPEFTEITQNNAITPFKVIQDKLLIGTQIGDLEIQGHRFGYQSDAHIRFPISD